MNGAALTRDEVVHYEREGYVIPRWRLTFNAFRAHQRRQPRSLSCTGLIGARGMD